MSDGSTIWRQTEQHSERKAREASVNGGVWRRWMGGGGGVQVVCVASGAMVRGEAPREGRWKAQAMRRCCPRAAVRLWSSV